MIPAMEIISKNLIFLRNHFKLWIQLFKVAKSLSKKIPDQRIESVYLGILNGTGYLNITAWISLWSPGTPPLIYDTLDRCSRGKFRSWPSLSFTLWSLAILFPLVNCIFVISNIAYLTSYRFLRKSKSHVYIYLITRNLLFLNYQFLIIRSFFHYAQKWRINFTPPRILIEMQKFIMTIN